MLIIGHRGAAGEAPENTLAGFAKAIELGVDWIEFDVRLTQDGHVVVVHDRHTRRIADERVQIRRSSLEALQNLKTASGEQIPTLQQVVVAVQGAAKLNIEVKTSGCARQVVKIIGDLVAAGHHYDEFLVSSFWPWILREVHSLNKDIPLGLLTHANSLSFLLPHGVPLAAIGLHWSQAGRLAVRLAKRRGLLVYVYTVNRESTFRRLQRMGVDAVVTDYPSKLLQLRPK